MIKVIAVVGPTASGKTDFGINLSKEVNGEIICADSRQIYRGMDIISAKPTPQQLKIVPHHLFGEIPRDINFTVADYVRLAGEKISEIDSRGKTPIIVGGTGLYIDSLLIGIEFPEIPDNPELRRKLEDMPIEEVYGKLKEVDPLAAEKIHINNRPRVIRALEVYLITGKTFTQTSLDSRPKIQKFQTDYIGLTFKDRQTLYNRIDLRTEEMLAMGMVDEARKIYEEFHGTNKNANNTIGYKELIPYFEGTQILEVCIEKVKKDTHHYAKRQLTWFKRNNAIKWIIQ